ncbi:hypothetical protein JHS3_12920 [Jeongeupia sp. HS-3]|nr:hypothetical protein JHS3_12920 [Jeongeupia sp. HS-3]
MRLCPQTRPHCPAYRVALLLAFGCVPITQAATLEADPQRWPLPSRASPVLRIDTGRQSHQITLAELESLPHYKVRLKLIWGERGTFQGVKLNDVLRRYGLENSRKLRFSASDRYTIEIDAVEWRRRDALIATRFESSEITVRQKGPLRLLWPDEADALGTTRGMLWIWNLTSINPVTVE